MACRRVIQVPSWRRPIAHTSSPPSSVTDFSPGIYPEYVFPGKIANHLPEPLNLKFGQQTTAISFLSGSSPSDLKRVSPDPTASLPSERLFFSQHPSASASGLSISFTLPQKVFFQRWMRFSSRTPSLLLHLKVRSCPPLPWTPSALFFPEEFFTVFCLSYRLLFVSNRPSPFGPTSFPRG